MNTHTHCIHAMLLAHVSIGLFELVNKLCKPQESNTVINIGTLTKNFVPHPELSSKIASFNTASEWL